jgi:hypothetical protein
MKNAFTVRLKPEALALLDMYAHKLEVSRNQLITNILHSSLDDLAILDHGGHLSPSSPLRELLSVAQNTDFLCEVK